MIDKQTDEEGRIVLLNSDICTAPTPDHKAVHTTLDILKIVEAGDFGSLTMLYLMKMIIKY